MNIECDRGNIMLDKCSSSFSAQVPSIFSLRRCSLPSANINSFRQCSRLSERPSFKATYASLSRQAPDSPIVAGMTEPSSKVCPVFSSTVGELYLTCCRPVSCAHFRSKRRKCARLSLKSSRLKTLKACPEYHASETRYCSA